MPRTWFDQLVVSVDKPRRSPIGVAFSIGTHAALAAALVVIPALGRAQLPEATNPPVVDVLTMPPVAAPPPPVVRIVPAPRQTAATTRVQAAGPVVERQRSTALPTGNQEYVSDPNAPAPCLVDCDPDGTSTEPVGAVGPALPAQTGPSEPVRVGRDIREPKRINYVAPTYPELARRARVQGVVILECVMDERGQVTDVQVLRGNALLDAAAVGAVRQWRYTPTLLNGVPVRVVMTVTVNFTLEGK